MTTRAATDPFAVPTIPAAPFRPVLARGINVTVRRLALAPRRHLAVLLVLAAFAAAAFVVPTMTPVATTDDWGYTRSVEILLDEGRLTVLPAVAATAVFQILWGALFGSVFGMSLGIVRVATVVMVALGAVALYAMARDLGVTRGRAALGTAVYLFNPLTFSLAFTYMTDPYFTSLMIISTALYVHGLRRPAPTTGATADDAGRMGIGNRWLLAASVAAGCAFLTRQQGALIPVGVALYLLASGQLLPVRSLRDIGRRVLLLASVGGLTALMLVGYYVWLRVANGVPSVQQSFLRDALDKGWPAAWAISRNMAVIILAYLGILLFPIVLPAVVGFRRVVRAMRPLGWGVVWVSQAILLIGVAHRWGTGSLMPYIGQFVGRTGLGPPDVFGARPSLLLPEQRQWLTVAAVAGGILLIVTLASRIGTARNLFRSRAGLLVAMSLVQLVGVLPPSFQYLTRGYSLDRYLLPLLPLTIVLALWALRDRRLFQPLGWLIIAAVSVFSVMGTRDYLVYMDAVWDYATYANGLGIDNQHLDAGAAWDGYHTYTFALENNIGARSPAEPDRPWWMTFYGTASDGSYVVSGTPRNGYTIVESRLYGQWLRDGPTLLFLLRRN